MYKHFSNIMLSKSDASDNNLGEGPESPLLPENGVTPPVKEPGEIYVIVMTVIGVLFGGTIGYFIGFPMAGVFLGVLCVIGGAILGGTVGAFIGGRMKDLKIEREKEKKGN